MMNKKEFIVSFFIATHINRSYSEYETWDNNKHKEEYQNKILPDEVVHLSNMKNHIECFDDVLDSFDEDLDINIFTKKYLMDFEDFDFYVKNIKDLIENFDIDDTQNPNYQDYTVQNIYYDKEYNLYYTDYSYKPLFDRFLEKHNLFDIWNSNINEEITKKEFIAKYYYSMHKNFDYPSVDILRRKDIRLIKYNTTLEEVYSYFREYKDDRGNVLIDAFKKFLDNYKYDYLFEDDNL